MMEAMIHSQAGASMVTGSLRQFTSSGGTFEASSGGVANRTIRYEP